MGHNENEKCQRSENDGKMVRYDRGVVRVREGVARCCIEVVGTRISIIQPPIIIHLYIHHHCFLHWNDVVRWPSQRDSVYVAVISWRHTSHPIQLKRYDIMYIYISTINVGNTWKRETIVDFVVNSVSVPYHLQASDICR